MGTTMRIVIVAACAAGACPASTAAARAETRPARDCTGYFSGYAKDPVTGATTGSVTVPTGTTRWPFGYCSPNGMWNEGNGNGQGINLYNLKDDPFEQLQGLGTPGGPSFEPKMR